MKKITMSMVSILTFSSMAMAGGDIVPVEPVVLAPTVEEVLDESAFYAGLVVSYMKLHDEFSAEEFTANGIMLQAGYQFNRYFAIEGRYTRN
ncbi:MAG TPA: porin family protein, partial [Epsilonproteobacteria bacterium]|nr:porin family protein [Campylobacterota bacterium]